eukprot:6210219-Pleurochrysis_carterae.AAC.2
MNVRAPHPSPRAIQVSTRVVECSEPSATTRLSTHPRGARRRACRRDTGCAAGACLESSLVGENVL